MVNGLFATQFKNGDFPPVCGPCQTAPKKVEDARITQIRTLFVAAAAHHIPRDDSPKVAGRLTHCNTADPAAAMTAWLAVLEKAHVVSMCCGLDDDPWLCEVKADALYGVACMQSLLGEKAAALETLDRVIRTGYAKFELMSKEGDFDGLRDDPAFSEKFAALVEERHRPRTSTRAVHQHPFPTSDLGQT